MIIDVLQDTPAQHPQWVCVPEDSEEHTMLQASGWIQGPRVELADGSQAFAWICPADHVGGDVC